MIVFVDRYPSIEPHGDGFLVTFKSGEESIQLMLTRHAALGIGPIFAKAWAKATLAQLDKEPIKFPAKKRKRTDG